MRARSASTRISERPACDVKEGGRSFQKFGARAAAQERARHNLIIALTYRARGYTGQENDGATARGDDYCWIFVCGYRHRFLYWWRFAVSRAIARVGSSVQSARYAGVRSIGTVVWAVAGSAGRRNFRGRMGIARRTQVGLVVRSGIVRSRWLRRFGGSFRNRRITENRCRCCRLRDFSLFSHAT